MDAYGCTIGLSREIQTKAHIYVYIYIYIHMYIHVCTQTAALRKWLRRTVDVSGAGVFGRIHVRGLGFYLPSCSKMGFRWVPEFRGPFVGFQKKERILGSTLGPLLFGNCHNPYIAPVPIFHFVLHLILHSPNINPTFLFECGT